MNLYLWRVISKMTDIIAKVFSCPLWGIHSFYERRIKITISAGALILLCLRFSEGHSLSSRVWVLSVVYFCQDPAIPHKINERGPHTFVLPGSSGPGTMLNPIMGRTSLSKQVKLKAYLRPMTEVIMIKHEQSIMSGDDDDNTGGTGHNMPWDD